MRKILLAAAALFVFSIPAYAASIDLTAMSRNGVATTSGTDLVLTPSTLQVAAGSAFIGTPFAVSNSTVFSAKFDFMISNPVNTGADGLAFVIQNDTAGATELGGAGAGIGYSGISNSLVVEFDTWNNGGVDNFSENHIGINIDGNLDSVVLADPGFDLDVAMATAWVDYDGATLSVFTSNTGGPKPGAALISTAIDLGAIVGTQAYFGFSAATAGASAQHKITSFDLEVSAIPLPAGLPLLIVGLGVLGSMRLRARR